MPSAISFEPVRYRLCWLRESAPGHIDADLGLDVAPQQLLPALAGLRPRDQPVVGQALLTAYGLTDAFDSYKRFAMLPVYAVRRLSVMFGALDSPERLAAARRDLDSFIVLTATVDAAAPSAGPVEVHLPYVDYDRWSSRFDLLRDLRFGYNCGRMLPAEVAARPEAVTAHQALLAASTSFGSGQHYSVAGFDRAISGSACGAWRAIPPEKHLRYCGLICGMTVAIQNAIRRWMEQYWISRNMDNLAEPAVSWPILAYVHSAPFPGRRPRQFTYNLQHSAWIYDMTTSARNALRRAVKRIQIELWQADRYDLSRFYARTSAKQILDKVRKDDRTLTQIATVEAAIVNRFVHWGNIVSRSTDPREVENACSELAADLHAGVRQLPGGSAAAHLPSLLLAEATYGLNWAMGGRQKMRHLRISKQTFEPIDDLLNGDPDQLLAADDPDSLAA
jgi:hypothetical protein